MKLNYNPSTLLIYDRKIIANLRAGMEVHRTDSEDRVNFSDVEQNYRSIEAWLDDDNSWGIGIPTDLFEGVPEDNDDERDDINGLPHYRDTITNSTAYKWLISKLHNVLDLMPTQPNTMGEISDYIHDSFAHKPQFRQFSRATNPHICDMEFIVDWDPLIFLEEQSYDGPPEEVIARALTLTGTMENAQALTVEQYLKQTWHKSGEEVLALVQKLVKSGERRQPNIVGQ